MRSFRWYVAAVAVLVGSLLVLPAQLTGQQKPVDFDLRAGIGVPVGDLADVADPGPSFGLGVDFGVTERLAIRLDGGAELYPGAIDFEEFQEGVNQLELDLIHLRAGGAYHLLLPARRGWFVDVSGGVGVSNLHIPRVERGVGNSTVRVEVSELYLSAGAALKGGYRVADRASLFGEVRSSFVFADEEDTRDLGRLADELTALGTTVSLPLTVGVRLHF